MSINLINYALAKKDWKKFYEDLEVLGAGGRNLIIEKKITHGYFIDKDGNIMPFTNAFVTDFIDIQGASSIAVSTNGQNNTKRVAFYDQNKVFIPPRFLDISSETSVIVPVPSNAKYVRFSSDNFASGYFKLEKGNKATDWTPAPEDIGAHPFVAELAETIFRSKQNEERIRNLENAISN